MTTRKDFLAAAAAVPLLAAAPTPAPGAAPVAAPSDAPKQKVSQLARAFAARMRDFDPALSDADLEKIAAGIDGNLQSGRHLDPKGDALRNWDEPATVFEVRA